MLSQNRSQTEPILSNLGLASNLKFEIGDYVFNTETHDVGRITSIVIGEAELGNLESVAITYCYMVLMSNQLWKIGQMDEQDEGNLVKALA